MQGGTKPLKIFQKQWLLRDFQGILVSLLAGLKIGKKNYQGPIWPAGFETIGIVLASHYRQICVWDRLFRMRTKEEEGL